MADKRIDVEIKTTVDTSGAQAAEESVKSVADPQHEPAPTNLVPSDFFEAMPSEVREIWLDSIAAIIGWPFQTLDDSIENTRWYMYLKGMPLREINRVRWSLETVRPGSQAFLGDVREQVEDLIGTHTKGLAPECPILRSKERFWSCVGYIIMHRTLPAPVVLLDDFNGEMGLFDGGHRLSAFAFLARKRLIPPDLPVRAWVGRSGFKRVGILPDPRRCSQT